MNDTERAVIKENGRKIEIVREPNRIVVTIEGADGKVSVFKADSEEELKKTSKPAWELVEKYLNQPDGLRIAIGGAFNNGAFGRGAGFNALPFDPFGNDINPFRRRRRPGQKDSLDEMARLLKEAKAMAIAGKKDRDLDKLQAILDKLDHMETHMDILRLERGQ